MYVKQMATKRKQGQSFLGKIDFQLKMVKRDKEGHYIIIKGSIYQEDIIMLSIYAPNIGAPKSIKQIQIELNGNINRNTIILRDFNTELSTWRDHPEFQ